MCKNIIFDIGNVLLNFKPKEYLRAKLMDPDKVLEVYEEIYESKEWIMLDKGVLTEEEAINILVERSSKNAHLIKLTFENWYDILTPIENSVNILKDLKALGYRVYYLSNFHLSAFENVTSRYDFFKIFDGGIVSYKEKLLKPEESIYKRIIEEYDIKPEESIFIDDTKVNIDAAGKLNFNTVLFKNPEDLREKLKKIYALNIC